MTKKILTLDNIPVIKKNIGRIDTIEKLKASTIYSLGDVVEVLGFHAKGDGSHHKRIAKAEDDGSGELGQNGIWWCIVHNGEVNVSCINKVGTYFEDKTLILDKDFEITTETKIKNIRGAGGVLTIKAYTVIDNVIDNKCNMFNLDLTDVRDYTKKFILLIKSRLVRPEWFGATCYNTETLDKYETYPDTDDSDRIIACVRACSGEYYDFPHLIPNTAKYGEYGGVNLEFDAGTYLVKKQVQIGDSLSGQSYAHNGLSFKGASIGSTFICNTDTETEELSVVRFYRLSSEASTIADIKITCKNKVNSVSNFSPKLMYCLWLDSCDSVLIKNVWVSGAQHPTNKSTGYGLCAHFSINTMFDNFRVEQCNNGISFVSGSYQFSNLDLFGIGNISLNFGGIYSWQKGNHITSSVYISNMTNYCNQDRFSGFETNANLRINNLQFLQLASENSIYALFSKTEAEKDCSVDISLKNVDLPLVWSNVFKVNNSADIIKVDGLKLTTAQSNSEQIFYADKGKIIAKDIIQVGRGMFGAKAENGGHVTIDGYDVNITNPSSTMGNIFECQQNSTINIDRLTGSSIEGKSLAFVSDDSSITIGDVFGYKGAKSCFGNGAKRFVSYSGTAPSLYTILDTPYYTLKMQQEGIYDDYIAYRDELHEYENSQTTDETMLLPVLHEPVIPESVKAFAEKYKLI